MGATNNILMQQFNGADYDILYPQTTYDNILNKPYVSNTNILDNWYFANPVNQRGITTATANQIGIDRWWSYVAAYNASSGVLSCNGAYPSQRIELNIIGKKCTASVLFSDGVMIYGTNTVSASGQTMFYNGAYGSVYMFDGYLFQFNLNKSVIAVKLEIGEVSTLGILGTNNLYTISEIPQYSEQLLRCQRYFQTFSNANYRPTNAKDFRPVMRANPSFSQIVVGSETLYIATADI